MMRSRNGFLILMAVLVGLFIWIFFPVLPDPLTARIYRNTRYPDSVLSPSTGANKKQSNVGNMNESLLYATSMKIHYPKREYKVPWTQRYYHLLKSLYPGHLKNGSWAYRAYEMESQLRIDQEAYNYHFYPQSIDLEDQVAKVRAGQPIVTKPVNNPQVTPHTTPSGLCTNSGYDEQMYDLLVAIKTCVQCVERRMHARNTFMKQHLWKHFRIRFFFVTGLPPQSLPTVFRFDGINVSYSHARYGKNDWLSAKHNLLREASTFDDLLIGLFDDHYYSLFTKQLFTFRWLATHCTRFANLFLFLDDDFGVVPVNLIRFVRSLPRKIQPKLNVGIKYQNLFVVRDNTSKWGMSRDEIPWPLYAPYFAGAAYMLGRDVLTDLAIGMLFQNPGRIDDAVMGITMFRLHYPIYTIKRFSHYVDSVEDLRMKVCAKTTYIDKYYDWERNRFQMKN